MQCDEQQRAAHHRRDAYTLCVTTAPPWTHPNDRAYYVQLVEEALAEAGEQQRSLAAEAAAFRRDAAATAARREAAAAVLRRLEAEGAMVAAAAGALRDKQAGLQARPSGAPHAGFESDGCCQAHTAGPPRTPFMATLSKLSACQKGGVVSL
jgi:hypothetical protein